MITDGHGELNEKIELPGPKKSREVQREKEADLLREKVFAERELNRFLRSKREEYGAELGAQSEGAGKEETELQSKLGELNEEMKKFEEEEAEAREEPQKEEAEELGKEGEVTGEEQAVEEEGAVADPGKKEKAEVRRGLDLKVLQEFRKVEEKNRAIRCRARAERNRTKSPTKDNKS